MYNVSSENLVLDQLIIFKLKFFFILITYLVDIVLISQGEILSWSLMGVEGLKKEPIKKGGLIEPSRTGLHWLIIAFMVVLDEDDNSLWTSY